MSQTLVWFRNDLRVFDNPALFHAVHNSDSVAAVFFIARAQWQRHNLSERRIQLTLGALHNLQGNLLSMEIPLHVIEVDYFSAIPKKLLEICRANQFSQINLNCEYALDEKNRDDRVTELCQRNGIEVKTFHGSVIIPPGAITTGAHQPYKVFTPFKRAWLKSLSHFETKPLALPKKPNKNVTQNPPPTWVQNVNSNHLWPVSEKEAHRRLKIFIETRVESYRQQRDLPTEDGTSQLSPYLTVGLISPRTCLDAALSANRGELDSGNEGISTWINEIIWREFYIHVLAAFPNVCKHRALRPETELIRWHHDENLFQRWCDGETGFPLVDAAMHQLNTSGWMHNRLRMVTATFLSKYLLIDWRWGERYFMQQLVDGHFAANNGGWQWCASTGSDAAPYFRVLSPVRQGERFDSQAVFIKSMLPQLTDLPAKIIHQPGHPQLIACGYPEPIVDLKSAKAACVEAFKNATDLYRHS